MIGFFRGSPFFHPNAPSTLPTIFSLKLRGRTTASFILGLVVVVGGLRLLLIFMSLQMSRMSTTHTILNGSPVMVAILSHCVGGKEDRCTVSKVFACILLLVGIYLTSEIENAVDEAVSLHSYLVYETVNFKFVFNLCFRPILSMHS